MGQRKRRRRGNKEIFEKEAGSMGTGSEDDEERNNEERIEGRMWDRKGTR